MDSLEFVASVVSSLAWPVCVGTVAYLFRQRIAQLLANVSALELPGGIKADFKQGIRQIEQTALVSTQIESSNLEANAEVAESGADQVGPATEGANDAQSKQLRAKDEQDGILQALQDIKMFTDVLAEANNQPNGLVMETWRTLESALFAVVKPVGFPRIRYADTLTWINKLVSMGILSESEKNIALELRRLRNLAAHAEANIDALDAARYVSLARMLIQSLQRARPATSKEAPEIKFQ